MVSVGVNFVMIAYSLPWEPAVLELFHWHEELLFTVAKLKTHLAKCGLEKGQEREWASIRGEAAHGSRSKDLLSVILEGALKENRRNSNNFIQ